MTSLRSMKGITIKKKGHTYNSESSSTTAIKSLPKELLIGVVARVASHSFVDLINVKKSCKDFLDAAEDSHVHKHVSLDKIRWLWPRDDKELSFLKRCKESKNMEILFREGFQEYFSYPNGNIDGLEIMKIAAEKGHKEAKYVYGMIMLCSENEELRKEGLEHVRFLMMSRCVIRCRNMVEKLTRCMWINNKMLLRNQKLFANARAHAKGGELKKVDGYY